MAHEDYLWIDDVRRIVPQWEDRAVLEACVVLGTKHAEELAPLPMSLEEWELDCEFAARVLYDIVRVEDWLREEMAQW